MSSATTLSQYEIERNKPIPSLNHSLIQINIALALGPILKNRFRLASELSLDLQGWLSTPDLCFLPIRKIDPNNDIIKFDQEPLRVIEILSASQNPGDLVSKAYQYFEKGVKSCWIVIPSLTNIHVFSDPTTYEVYKSNETLVDKVLDIELPLEEIFV